MRVGERHQRERISVPNTVLAVIQRLQGAGHQAYVVGGGVRDCLAGRPPGDWDVATSAEPGEVAAVFERVHPTGIKHGTVTVTDFGEPVEVTTFRGEGPYLDGRRPSRVWFVKDIEADLARRDFTINAIAYDPISDVLVDPYDGLGDIRRKVVRAVGRPHDRFQEDRLRMMRAVRFAAVFEYALDPETRDAIAELSHLVATVSVERISAEFKKMLAAPRPSAGIELMRELGLARAAFPWLDPDPTREAYPHASYRHVLRVLDAAAARGLDVILRFAALVHVPLDLSAIDKRASSLGEELGRIAAERARGLKFSGIEVRRVQTATAYLGTALRCEWTPARVRRWLGQVGRENAPDVVALAAAHLSADEFDCPAAGPEGCADAEPPVADAQVHAGPGYLVLGCTARADSDRPTAGARARQNVEALERIVREVIRRGDPLTVGELAIGGEDLIRELGVPKGPEVGRLLHALLEAVLDDPSLNSRSELLRLADEALRSSGLEDKSRPGKNIKSIRG